MHGTGQKLGRDEGQVVRYREDFGFFMQMMYAGASHTSGSGSETVILRNLKFLEVCSGDVW